MIAAIMSTWTPHYQRGSYKRKDVYVVSSGDLSLITNHEYQTKPGIPPCQEGSLADPDAVYYIAQQIMNVVIKAALSVAHIPPELATFAGPLTKSLATDVETFVQRNGGDIKKFLDAIGASKTYAGCLPVTLIVPKGSSVLSIDAWTNRRAKAAGSYKAGEKSFDTLPPGQWERVTKSPTDKNVFDTSYGAWRIGEKGAVISAILINWSHTDDLHGRLQVFFDPPEDWKIDHPLNDDDDISDDLRLN